MNKLLLTILYVCYTVLGIAQEPVKTLSLFQAYDLVRLNNPQLKDADILTQIAETEQTILNKAKLPSLHFKTDGRVQSQSVQLDLPPGSNLPFTIDLPLYSVKSYVESNYLIYDGGLNKAQQTAKASEVAAEQSKLALTQYQLQNQIAGLFLAINKLTKQQSIFDYSIKSLQARKDVIEAGVSEGALLPSELARIDVKIAEIQSKQNTIKGKLRGLLSLLSGLLATNVDEKTEFTFPTIEYGNLEETSRPEQTVIQSQTQNLDAKKQVIDAAKKPKLGAFVQGGVGYPNPLNFLESNTAAYALGGVQFNWQLTDWKKSNYQKELIDLNAQRLQNANDALLYSISAQEQQYWSQKVMLNEQIKLDRNIAQLQTEILKQLEAQLDEGVITSAEYIQQVNTELKAKQTILLREAELLELDINYWNLKGAKRN